jgi:hypothetical protein
MTSVPAMGPVDRCNQNVQIMAMGRETTRPTPRSASRGAALRPWARPGGVTGAGAGQIRSPHGRPSTRP